MLGAVAARSEQPAQPAPAAQHTPEQVMAAVRQISGAKSKRDKISELRRSFPAPLLADALAGAIACEPAFADDMATRSAAYEGLGSVGEPSPEGVTLISDVQVDQLVAGLKERDDVIRRLCASSLGRVPERRRESVVGPLTAAADDASVAVTQQALLSLAKLRLTRPVPGPVREMALAPSAAMKAKWTAADAKLAESGAAGGPSCETAVREMAMGVIASWEGLGVLVDHDLSKDERGRGARAIAVGRRVLKDPSGAGLDERQLGMAIGELAGVLREPGGVRDADRGAALTLGALANKGASEPVRRSAKEALREALETAPEAKRELIREALTRAR